MVLNSVCVPAAAACPILCTSAEYDPSDIPGPKPHPKVPHQAVEGPRQYNNAGYDQEGYDHQGYAADGYDENGVDK